MLTANPNAEASGPIIESRLDVGRGPVATMLVQRGTLKVGDAIVAGDAWGRVRALYDYRGEQIESAGPGDPVEILGFDKPPPAGELGRVVENDRRARDLAQQRGERLRRESLAKQSSRGVSLEKLFEQLQAGGVADLNIVLKGDVQGSVEAIVGELQKIDHSEVRVNVIHTGVGGITENDVNLAAASNAMVIGFNVRPSTEARQLAERQGIEIRQYRVIYELTQQIEQALVGMLSPVETEAVIGEVEVRALFRASRVGTIAGCMVTSGVVRRGSQRPHLPRRRPHPRDDGRRAQALQGRRPRGDRGLRVRDPARGLQRPARGRHLRGLRDARGRADLARRAARLGFSRRAAGAASAAARPGPLSRRPRVSARLDGDEHVAPLDHAVDAMLELRVRAVVADDEARVVARRRRRSPRRGSRVASQASASAAAGDEHAAPTPRAASATSRRCRAGVLDPVRQIGRRSRGSARRRARPRARRPPGGRRPRPARAVRRSSRGPTLEGVTPLRLLAQLGACAIRCLAAELAHEGRGRLDVAAAELDADGVVAGREREEQRRAAAGERVEHAQALVQPVPERSRRRAPG